MVAVDFSQESLAPSSPEVSPAGLETHLNFLLSRDERTFPEN
jgi:hypothetical protein